MTSQVTAFLLIALLSLSTASNQQSGYAKGFLQRDQEGYAEDNGGTVCAIGGSDWCVLASDTRLRKSYGIVTRGASRIYLDHCSNSFGVASAGCWADTLALRGHIERDLERFRWESRWGDDRGNSPMTREMVQRLAGILYRRRGTPFYAQNVVGGLDENGRGVAYGFDPLGSFESVPVACAGSARALIQPVLDGIVEERPEGIALKPLDVTDATRLVLAAYKAAAERDITVGDECEMWVWQKGHPPHCVRETLRRD